MKIHFLLHFTECELYFQLLTTNLQNKIKIEFLVTISHFFQGEAMLCIED